MKFILGKKLEMSQIFQDNGIVVPVTLVKAGPCFIVCLKTKDKDGYDAAQIGFEKKKKLIKPLSGQLKGLDNFRYLKEFRLEKQEDYQRGDKIDVSVFQAGDKIQATGFSKGRGFTGVVKRHGFHGSPASHGHKDQLRMPGSIGAGGVGHVLKGVRMGGRMGAEQVTVKNLEIMEIDQENNVLAVKGALPGARNGLIVISGLGEMKLSREEKMDQVKELEIKDEKINLKEDSLLKENV